MDIKNFEEFCKNYKECLEKIDQSYNCMFSENPTLSEISRRAFKADMIDLFKILEQYSSFILKSYKISVSDMTVGESLKRCAQVNKIDKCLVENTRKYKALRDKYSHHYGKPALRNFVEFYKNSKDALYNQYSLMLGILKNLKLDNSDNMNYF